MKIMYKCHNVSSLGLTLRQVVAKMGFMPTVENETLQDKATENLANGSHPENPFVNRNRIASRYAVCERTIQNMMRKRILPYHKVGRCVRFKISDCDAAWERFKRDSIAMKGVSL